MSSLRTPFTFFVAKKDGITACGLRVFLISARLPGPVTDKPGFWVLLRSRLTVCPRVTLVSSPVRELETPTLPDETETDVFFSRTATENVVPFTTATR
ncbi:MAG: hypothetical protein OIF56_02760 [Cohaesibacter sp.]|nr:hypothetical protein [Cohaesibacter sp.]MCV6601103.1 hypothetical protein [Cohaesibacter sp.]